MKQPHPETLTPQFLAGIKLIQGTGARSFRIGYSDPDDGPPDVWYVCVEWGIDPATGRPLQTGGRISHEAAAAMTPLKAVLRLCEQVIDGGRCAHCGEVSSFVPDGSIELLNETTCVVSWNPAVAEFRRGCEDKPA